jgi:hypothetical protein
MTHQYASWPATRSVPVSHSRGQCPERFPGGNELLIHFFRRFMDPRSSGTELPPCSASQNRGRKRLAVGIRGAKAQPRLGLHRNLTRPCLWEFSRPHLHTKYLIGINRSLDLPPNTQVFTYASKLTYPLPVPNLQSYYLQSLFQSRSNPLQGFMGVLDWAPHDLPNAVMHHKPSTTAIRCKPAAMISS